MRPNENANPVSATRELREALEESQYLLEAAMVAWRDKAEMLQLAQTQYARNRAAIARAEGDHG